MVYFISGLGADERVFQFLELPNISKKFIQWVTPTKAESLTSYCTKLISQIDHKQEVILVGISFGGIIAQEISKIIPCKKVIIISSIKTIAEFNWQLYLVSKTRIHKITPFWLLNLMSKLTANYYFGVQGKEESKLLKTIIEDTDPKFLVWAIDQLLNWKNKTYPAHLIHLHGTADKVFPIRKIKDFVQIPNGGHFMIVNKAQQIEPLILALIKQSDGNT